MEEKLDMILDHVAKLSEDVQELKVDFADFKSEMQEFKTDMTGFKSEMQEFKTDMTDFKTEMLDFKTEMLSFKRNTEEKLDKIFFRLKIINEDNLNVRADVEKLKRASEM